MPRFKTIINTGAEYGVVTVRAATAISAGCVVCWEMDGTEDGLSVTVPAATTAFLVAGIAPAAIASGAKGEAVCYGLVTNARVARVGSASNDNVAVGDVYDIYSASSMLSYVKAGAAVVESASDAASGKFVAAATVGSGGASSLSSTTTKVWVRLM